MSAPVTDEKVQELVLRCLDDFDREGGSLAMRVFGLMTCVGEFPSDTQTRAALEQLVASGDVAIVSPPTHTDRYRITEQGTSRLAARRAS